MQTKQMHGVTVKDAALGTVQAVFATLNVVDHDGDVTLPGAFKDGAQVVISSYGHKSWDGALPVGHGVIREVGDEAILDGQFLMDTTHGRDAFSTVKALSDVGLQEWSYSLQNVTGSFGHVDGQAVHFLEAIDVKEVSPVLVGAGIGTRTLATKSAGQRFGEHIAQVMADVNGLIERLRDVVTLRAEKGKTISDETAGHLDEVRQALKALTDLLEVPQVTEPQGEPDAEALAEFLRFIQNNNVLGDTE